VSYGTDTWCQDQLRTGHMVTGVELLAQALYRRLTKPRGTLDDGDEGIVYGLDVCSFIGRDSTPDFIDGVGPAIEAECLKDDRVSSLEASVTSTTNAAGETSVLVEVDVVPVDEATNTFTFTLSVSGVTVSFLGVSAT
jgi:hypothetical protein